jgi:ABC-type cobalamin/Fe3+-siderophores transport system ATPase subunit
MSVELVALDVENLRGFRRASLGLEREVTLLVGPNNSGKTSLLLLLDWVFNRADVGVLLGERPPSPEDCALLVPARQTRNQARRLQLRVRVLDGRRHHRFQCENGIAILRIGLRMSPSPALRLNLGPPRQSEGHQSDEEAANLLKELRRRFSFRLVPASRDATSERFETTLRSAITARLAERAVHQQQGGAPSEYRAVNKALGRLSRIASDLANPLWQEMEDGLVPGLTRKGEFVLDAGAVDLVDWLASRLSFRLTTGDHDPNTVSPIEVGSGLQSLLDLAMMSSPAAGEALPVLAIEEPEAFLHPSAQRNLARRLFQAEGVKRLVSTHSLAMVEESQFGDVVLVRNHRIFEARPQDDERRAQINSALMTGHGAEAMFGRSVLLVEGPGDRHFFDGLRRRLAEFDEYGITDTLVVVPVGSNTAFAAWLRLFPSYGDESFRPIEWLVVADGDSTQALTRAMNDAQLTLSNASRDAMRSLRQAYQLDDVQAAEAAAEVLNSSTLEAGERLYVLPVDLEWCALANAGPAVVHGIAAEVGLDTTDAQVLADGLGSKVSNLGGPSVGRKAPWIRTRIAQALSWDELSDDAWSVLQRWVLATGDQNAQRLLDLVPGR